MNFRELRMNSMSLHFISTHGDGRQFLMRVAVMYLAKS